MMKDRKGRTDLIDFITEVQDLMDNLMTEDDYKKNFDEEILPKMQDAYGELSPVFELVREELNRVEPKKLFDHGLFGEQLEFKLELFKKYKAEIKETQKIGFLKHVLKSIDVLLDSIIAATGVGGPLKEFKDAMGITIELKEQKEEYTDDSSPYYK